MKLLIVEISPILLNVELNTTQAQLPVCFIGFEFPLKSFKHVQVQSCTMIL